MNKLLAVLAALLFAVAPAQADPYNLPQDCAIVASEAYVRVEPVACWCRLLFVQTKTARHVLCAWQLTEQGPVFCYDRDGTYVFLTIHERDARKLAAAIVKSRPGMVLVSANFVTP